MARNLANVGNVGNFGNVGNHRERRELLTPGFRKHAIQRRAIEQTSP